ncbi:MAG: response regulator transcription factor [Gaiellaceae bacterium]
MTRILVVDDEAKIVSFVSRALSAHGFVVDTAYDGARAVELAGTGAYDLVVLDLMLPRMDGFSVLRDTLKARPEQRVLVLSALSDVACKVKCLELGASDYVSKPFELAELVARIRARLREPAPPPAESVLRAGRLTLDLLRRTVDAGEGPVALSEREFLLLQHLMRKPGQVCTRQELLAEVWGFSFDPGTNVVDACVRRLRSKIGHDAIEALRNVGYSLSAP